MTEQIALIRLLNNSPARRLWLLQEAMRSMPLDRAIELARMAETFVTGSAVEAPKNEVAFTVDHQQHDEIVDQVSTGTAIPADSATDRRGLALSNDMRDRLLTRLAEGARNAELAAELGISAKQVQGLRMGCAREIARRRSAVSDKHSEQSAEHDQESAAAASIEEIVRYLRQQDDVVVPQEDGRYLVNGRFRMSAAELIARANRMRNRQRKPPFQMNGTDIQAMRGPGPSGHPVFWENSAAAEHRVSGWKKPAEIDN